MQVLYVYALIQIIFESLPVSSSGNVLLWMPVLQKVLGLDPIQNVLPDFDFLLHLPTIFIISVFFFYAWPFPLRKIQTSLARLGVVTICCMLADATTVLLYFFWNRVGTDFFPLWIGFFCTTLLLLSLRIVKNKNKKNKLSYQDALILGLVQGCAFLPGISRFASTFVAGIWLGYPDKKAFLYSFLIQVPLLGAACLKGLWSFVHAYTYVPFNDPIFYGVIIGASIVSFCVLSYVFGMVKRKTLWMFAWYTAFLSLIAKVFVS